MNFECRIPEPFCKVKVMLWYLHKNVKCSFSLLHHAWIFYVGTTDILCSTLKLWGKFSHFIDTPPPPPPPLRLKLGSHTPPHHHHSSIFHNQPCLWQIEWCLWQIEWWGPLNLSWPNFRISLVLAAMVIPTPLAYTNVAAVKKLIVGVGASWCMVMWGF